MSDRAESRPSDVKPVQKLMEVAEAAFNANPGNCSGAVYYVSSNLVDPAQIPSTAHYLQANQLMQTISTPGSHWRQVSTMEDASALEIIEIDPNDGEIVRAWSAADRAGRGRGLASPAAIS
jgi:hypothetical protein